MIDPTTPPNPADVDALLTDLVQNPKYQASINFLAIMLVLIDKQIATDQELGAAKEAATRLVIQQVKDSTSAADMKTMLFMNKVLGTKPSLPD